SAMSPTVEECPPVGGEGQAANVVLVPPQGGQVEAGLGVPQADAAVLAAGGKEQTIRPEGEREDSRPMPDQRPQALAAVHVPDQDPGIPTAGRQQCSIRAEGDALDLVL